MQTSALPSREPGAVWPPVDSGGAGIRRRAAGRGAGREGSSLLGSDAGELAGSGKKALLCKVVLMR